MKMPEQKPEFKQCPTGSAPAICFELIDFGTHHDAKWGKDYHKIWIGWEFPTLKMDDGRSFFLGKEYRLSSSVKSFLRQDLERWRGKAFDATELGPNGTWDMASIIGAPCLITVARSDNNRSYVDLIEPLPKGEAVPKGQQTFRHLEISTENFSSDVYSVLPDWMRKKIADSPEYKSIHGDFDVNQDGDYDETYQEESQDEVPDIQI